MLSIYLFIYEKLPFIVKLKIKVFFLFITQFEDILYMNFSVFLDLAAFNNSFMMLSKSLLLAVLSIAKTVKLHNFFEPWYVH